MENQLIWTLYQILPIPEKENLTFFSNVGVCQHSDKNIIMIFLIIVLIGISSLTIYFASKENNTASFMQGENNVPSSMPSGEEVQPGNNNSSDTQSNKEILYI